MNDEINFSMTSKDIKMSETFMHNLLKCESLCRHLCIKEDSGQMIKARDDEVRNNAGGFVFAVSDESRIRRFIILGSSGGTYYSSEKDLAMDNVNALVDIIERGRGSLILKEVYEVSLAGRNPKQEPLLLALALCARYNLSDTISKLKYDEKAMETDVAASKLKYFHELHKAAFGIVNDVCRIPTHLFTFVKYCEMVSQSDKSKNGKKSTGWGRIMRNAIQRWYASKTPEQLAMYLTKYPQRGGWSHRDLFRLAHPTLKASNFPTTILEYEQLYHFAVKGQLKTRKRNLSKNDVNIEQPAAKYSAVQMDTEQQSRALDLVEAVIALKDEKNEEKIVAAIKKHDLVREHIPTDMLNSVGVWQALLEKMPMTAMIRNLGKMQSIGVLIGPFRDSVIARLTSEEELKRAKIHPIHVLIAKTVYESCHGCKGKLKWDLDERIDEALEIAFYRSFINARPTNKRYCFAFDISGSMECGTISGTMLSCRRASAALSLVSLKNEKIAKCVGFSHNLIELPYNRDWTISRIVEHMDGLDFGSTDCALPMLWAKEENKKFDVFVVYTDNETWFGDVHPYQALRDYRKSSGILDARLVVMGMSSTNFTIADPDDAGMLDIVGFDSAVPTLLHDFVTGKI